MAAPREQQQRQRQQPQWRQRQLPPPPPQPAPAPAAAGRLEGLEDLGDDSSGLSQLLLVDDEGGRQADDVAAARGSEESRGVGEGGWQSGRGCKDELHTPRWVGSVNETNPSTQSPATLSLPGHRCGWTAGVQSNNVHKTRRQNTSKHNVQTQRLQTSALTGGWAWSTGPPSSASSKCPRPPPARPGCVR